MPNFYIDPDTIKESSVEFPTDEARHIARVLRHHRGDIIPAVDGMGYEYQIELTDVTKETVVGRIARRELSRIETRCSVTLAQALPKGRKMDDIIEKGTEIGVREFIPFISERSISRPDGKGGKTERWQQVALAAMKQCGRAFLPAVRPIHLWNELVASLANYDRVVVCWEGAALPLTRLQFNSTEKIVVLIGPEGGFSGEEIKLLPADITAIVGLGPRILRTETAGLVAVAVILAMNGELVVMAY